MMKCVDTFVFAFIAAPALDIALISVVASFSSGIWESHWATVPQFGSIDVSISYLYNTLLRERIELKWTHSGPYLKRCSGSID